MRFDELNRIKQAPNSMQFTKIALLACAGFTLTAGAQQSATNPVTMATGERQVRVITMDECLKLALEKNLDIRIQRVSPELDQLAIGIAKGAYDPSFRFSAVSSYSESPASLVQGTTIGAPQSTVSASSFSADIAGSLPTGLTYDLNGPLSDRTGTVITDPVHYNSSPGITLKQPILKNFWIDGTRYQIQLAKNQLKGDQLNLLLQIQTTVNGVRTAYFNLLYSRENVKVTTAALKLAEQLLSENRKRVEVGALAPLDEKQAESQAATSRADLIAAEQGLNAQENTLKALITDDFGTWATVTPVPAETLLAIAPELDLQESWRLALSKRPEYLHAQTVVERQNISVRYGKNQLYPEVDLTGSYGRSATDPTFNSNLNDLANGTAPNYSAGISLSIPLGNVVARNNLKSYKAQVKQALLQLKKEEQTIVIQIDNDVKAIRAGYQRVGATREASQYAKAALEAEQKKLENGKSTSFVVLQLQSNLTTARSAEIRALADYNIALSQLALDEGTILEKNKIEVAVK